MSRPADPGAAGRIGSPAPLWRVASPRVALRAIAPFAVLLAAAAGYLLLTGGDSVGARVAVWIFGAFVGLVGLAAVAGWAIRRRMSARMAALAADRGWRFDGGLDAGAEQMLRQWPVTVAGRAPRARDAVTGELSGRQVTSFDYRCVWGRGEYGVRVAVVDLPRPLPTVELTPWRLPRVDPATLPPGPSAEIGNPAVAAAFHVAPEPSAAAGLLTRSVAERLVSAEPTAWRVSGSLLVALWDPAAPTSAVDSRLRTLAALAGELADPGVVAAPDPRPVPARALDPDHYTGSLAGRWRLPPFGARSGVTASMVDVTRGRLADGRPYVSFGYERRVDTARPDDQQRWRVVSVALPAALPLLEVGPEPRLPEPGAMRLTPDVDIENDDFNRAYRVSAADRKYAVDVLNPRAVEALLAGPPFDWRIEGADLVGFWPEADGAGDGGPHVRTRLEALSAIAHHIPAHVWSDLGWSREHLARVPAPDEPDVELPPSRPWHVALGVGSGLAALGLGWLIAALALPEAGPAGWFARAPVLLAIAVAVGVLAGLTPRIVRGARASASAYAPWGGRETT